MLGALNNVGCLYAYVHSNIILNSHKWKQPECPLVVEGVNRMWHIHMVAYPFSLKEEGDADTCYNMDGPAGHFLR